ncbi:MAG: dihydrodipicolinate synthase family protein [Armatimonadia bacterium]
MNGKLRGIIPALATPLLEDGKPDEAGLRKLVQLQLEGGVAGFFPCGSTGEGPMFPEEDWATVIRIVCEEAGGKVPVLAHVAEPGTERVIERAKRAVDLGADAVVSTLPYYYVHAGREAVRFFTAVADASPLPLFVYNVPQRTQVPLSADLLVELSEHPNILGVKDSAVDPILHFDLIHRLRNSDFTVLNGSEFFLGASVMMGGDGGLLGICNLIPKLCVELYEAAARGDIPAVRKLQPQVSDVTTVFFAKGGSALAALKKAMEMMGICQRWTSHPFLPTTPEGDEEIRGILERNGLL